MRELIPLNDTEYRQISKLVYAKFGIVLGEQKRSLIVGRLNKTLRDNGFESFSQYYKYVVSDATGKALSTLVDNISTNHTFFNREKDHFELLLKSVLPEITEKLKKNNHKVLRIWCSASSSGEEPYTLAMLLHEFFKGTVHDWDTGVLATDISSTKLQAAKQGIYSDDNVSNLPKAMTTKYFKKMPDGNWQVDDSIKKMVLFRRLNLMRKEFPFKNIFQIIFSRNVMIYFDKKTREELVKRYYHHVAPGGYLFIGHSETLGRNNNLFRYVQPAVYQKSC